MDTKDTIESLALLLLTGVLLCLVLLVVKRYDSSTGHVFAEGCTCSCTGSPP